MRQLRVGNLGRQPLGNLQATAFDEGISVGCKEFVQHHDSLPLSPPPFLYGAAHEVCRKSSIPDGRLADSHTASNTPAIWATVNAGTCWRVSVPLQGCVCRP